MEAYEPFFENKIVFCNCDDPYESEFFKYFAVKFNELKLKKLIATCYVKSPIAYTEFTLFDEFDELKEENTYSLEREREKKPYKIEITEVKDYNKDNAIDIYDVEWLLKNKKNALTLLKGDGDFRSQECINLLKEVDVVVTNPPFSLFREYVAQLVEYNKKFLIIGNQNAITYKEIFPLIKNNLMWLGVSIHSGDREFQIPKSYPLKAAGYRVDKDGNKFIRVKGVRWFTNIEHKQRHEPLKLMSMSDNLKFNKKIKEKGYPKYDNYDAIDVSYTDAIPSDYDGAMGVPITFLDKYCPEQFEIIGITESNGRGLSAGLWNNQSNVLQPTINNFKKYVRIFIKLQKRNNENNEMI